MLVSILGFIALWVGASTAHELKGWRSLLLPVVNVLVIILGIVLFGTVIGGFALSIQSLAVDFGIIPAR
jgi:hypothetical protein